VKRLILLALAGVVPVAVAVAALRANGPDPFVQAQADGCARDRTAILTQNAPNWAYVNDKDFAASGPPPAPRWVSGVVQAANLHYLAAHPSGGDDPFTHSSYDFNVNILPDLQYGDLLGGSAAAKTSNYGGEGEETGRLHTERELGSLPSFVWAEPNDRITELGSWVWDCDHTTSGERAEFHPIRAIWLERNSRGSVSGDSPNSPYGEAEGDLFVSTDGTPAAIEANCGHKTKGDPVAFKACVHSTSSWVDVNGDYRFTLRAPPRPGPTAKLTVRVVDRGSQGAPAVLVKRSVAAASLSLTIAAAPGKPVVVAKQVFLGWAPMPVRAVPEHLRVRFDSILIRRAMDPSCPTDKPDCPFKAESLRLGQTAAAPGEWNVYWDVNGIWGQWRPAVLRAKDGQSFAGSQTVDVYVGRTQPWRLFSVARECDLGVLGSFRGQAFVMPPCPRTNEIGNPSGDDYPGAVQGGYWLPARSLGRHTTNSIVTGSTCPPENVKGCYALTYTVTRVDDAKTRTRSK
jgi:hypothetical protein